MIFISKFVCRTLNYCTCKQKLNVYLNKKEFSFFTSKNKNRKNNFKNLTQFKQQKRFMATGTKDFKVAIIGGGVMGFSCGIRILETYPGSEVSIFTEQLSPNTTSDVAAGLWTPVLMGDTPSHLIDLWSGETYEYCQQIMSAHPEPLEHGIHYCPGYRIYTYDPPPEISWAGIPIGFRLMTKSELALFPSSIKSGYYYMTIMAEGRKIVPYLMNKYQKLGGRVVSGTRLTSFDDIVKQGYIRIVNCTGLGARELCKDDNMYPVRGQIHRVVAPWMNFFFMEPDSTTYCLPNSDTVVLGGTAQKGDWNLEVSEADKQDILKRVTELWPALASAPIVQDCVGLRPSRVSTRLEREKLGEYTIYHNYGHGGSGITTFWGCANSVLKLMQEDEQARQQQEQK